MSHGSSQSTRPGNVLRTRSIWDSLESFPDSTTNSERRPCKSTVKHLLGSFSNCLVRRFMAFCGDKRRFFGLIHTAFLLTASMSLSANSFSLSGGAERIWRQMLLALFQETFPSSSSFLSPESIPGTKRIISSIHVTLLSKKFAIRSLFQLALFR